ncbi:DUF4954 family protein, partial [archaeon]
MESVAAAATAERRAECAAKLGAARQAAWSASGERVVPEHAPAPTCFIGAGAILSAAPEVRCMLRACTRAGTACVCGAREPRAQGNTHAREPLHGAHHFMFLQVINVYVRGPVVVSGSSVYNSTLLAVEGAPTLIQNGAVVTDSVLHPGSIVDDNASVADSLLFSLSGVRRAGMVMESVIASTSCVYEAEVGHCLVGPLVGSHHTALLIACLWPHGKGNLAYGANVGSNHTGKLPDQELMAGEGIFFGLTTGIKFPANFAQAPYTLIATGVNTLPQKMDMPFSLVNEPSTGSTRVPILSPAINELFPGWMLSDNMYALY